MAIQGDTRSLELYREYYRLIKGDTGSSDCGLYVHTLGYWVRSPFKGTCIPDVQPTADYLNVPGRVYSCGFVVGLRIWG